MSEKRDIDSEQANATQDADQDVNESANGEIEENGVNGESRRRILFVGLLVIALVAVGGAGAYWFFSITPKEASESRGSSLQNTASNAASDRVSAQKGEAMAPAHKSWTEDEALVARLSEIDARLRRIEAVPLALERANVWLQAAQKNLEEPGGARFALLAARVAAALLEQTNTPRARLALSDLRHLIAQLETLDASAGQAFDAIHVVLAWMDDSLAAVSKSQAEAQAEVQTEAAQVEESLWGKGVNVVTDLLSEVFQVRRDEEVLSAAWQVVVVRRALVLAQAALLDRDKAAWHIAMRHALSAAQQLPSSELIEKVKAAQAIEVTFADEKMRARLLEILSALQSSSEAPNKE